MTQSYRQFQNIMIELGSEMKLVHQYLTRDSDKQINQTDNHNVTPNIT